MALRTWGSREKEKEERNEKENKSKRSTIAKTRRKKMEKGKHLQ